MAVGKIEILAKKDSSCRRQARTDLMKELRVGVLQHIVAKRKYRNPNYTARKLAEDMQTNVNYISAVVRVQFHTNYTSFINKYRVEEAKELLANRQNSDLNVEDIGYKVGFSNRQSFYNAFQKLAGMTPNHYRKQFSKS